MNPMTQYPPRPTLTDDVLEAIVEVFIKERPDFEEKLGEESAADIAAEYSLGMDGFDLCKRLEKFQCWDTDRDDLDVLDELDWHVRQYIKQAETNWIEHNNIQPPYPNGTRVAVTSRRSEIGIIDGVCEHSPGSFLIAPENPNELEIKHNVRRVVLFEDVRPADGVTE